jgi:hypothetical protein
MSRVLITSGVTTACSKVSRTGDANWEEVIAPGQYPNYDVNRDGVVVTRAFKVPAEELNDFGGECMPPGLPGEHPGIDFIFVDTVGITPFSDGNIHWYQHDSGYTEPGFYMCVVRYSRMINDIGTGGTSDNSNGADLYDGEVNITNEVMLLESDGFKWAGDTKKISERMMIPKIIPVIERTINIPRVIVIPWGVINAANGKVNSASYMGVPSEQLLYCGAQVKFKRAFDGVMSFGISHKFKQKSISVSTGPSTSTVVGWNHFYDTVDETWKKTDKPVYVKAPFFGLLPGVT